EPGWEDGYRLSVACCRSRRGSDPPLPTPDSRSRLSVVGCRSRRGSDPRPPTPDSRSRLSVAGCRSRRGSDPRLPTPDSRSLGATGGRGIVPAPHRCDDFVAAPSVLDRGEADMAGHQDSPAVPVEGAARIDIEVARPFESVAAVADREAELVVAAIEADIDALAAVLGKDETPLHFRRPSPLLEKSALLVVGDAEVPVLDGIDHQLG